jgi:hypothetical protein
MPDKFKGSASVTLYPGDVNVPLVLRFPPASGSTMNDGAVPYGSTISASSALVYYLDDGSAGTTTLLSTTPVSASSHNVTVWLTHSTAVKKGLHSVVATVTWALSGSTRLMTRPFDLDRVFVK